MEYVDERCRKTGRNRPEQARRLLAHKNLVRPVLLFMVLGSLPSWMVYGGDNPPSPHLISYQGTVSKAGMEESLATNMKFSVFDAQDDGVEVWGPMTASSVPVVEGRFSVILGPEDDPLVEGERGRPLAAAFSGGERFLQITVGAGSPMVPRQRILSVPYAFNSGNDIPVGGIVPWVPPGSVASLEDAKALVPPGFRVCSGPETGEIDDDSTLFNETKIPNLLEDIFLKGATPLQAQDGTKEGSNTHTHSVNFTTGDSGGWTTFAWWRSGAPSASVWTHTHSFSGATANQNDRNLPRNVSVLYIIRVE